MPYFKHAQDDGDLSVVTSGDEVLIACTHGHYWVLEATMRQAPSSDETAGPHRAAARHVMTTTPDLEKFGPLAERALRAR